tara:strand:+ start:521 stop:673 length:153 start_codon:yes stop_codon:yes gene_type:complete
MFREIYRYIIDNNINGNKLPVKSIPTSQDKSINELKANRKNKTYYFEEDL